jgi:beta-glucanase (GH16 family)
MRIILIFYLLLCMGNIFAQHFTCNPRHFYQVVPQVDANCCGRDQVYVTGDPTPCNNDGWVLYFEDNFDDQTLDLSKWRYPYQGVLGGYNFVGWKNWYANTGTTPSRPVSDNVVVENGKLKIIARKEVPAITGTVVTSWTSGGAPLTTMTTDYDYSSGWIESKKNFGYGLYEVRCQIPKGKGMWPAFWLFSGQYDAAIEIDVFEFWNENCGGSYDASKLSENAHMNLHSNRKDASIDRTCPSELYGSCSGYPNSAYLSEGFHTYALEWDYYKVVWYIDGSEVRRDYRFVNLNGQNLDCNSFTNPMLYAQYWPSADNMNVRFNLGIQNGSNAPDAVTTFPKEFQIEYFRYYKQASCLTNNIITTNPQLNLSSELYNTRMGQNVTISGTATVNSNQQLEVIGSNSVVLDPGFEAANGSDFIAHIDQGFCNPSALAVNTENQERIADDFSENAIQGNSSLDVNDLSADSDILKVYPNPTSDHLMIELTSGGVNMIEITDSQGRSLLSDSRALNEAMKLDVSTFSPGTYFIKILNKQSGKVYLERFTKNK